MDTGDARRLNRSSPSCLNSRAQPTDFFHGLFDIPRAQWPLLCTRIDDILSGQAPLVADCPAAVEHEAQRIAAQAGAARGEGVPASGRRGFGAQPRLMEAHRAADAPPLRSSSAVSVNSVSATPSQRPFPAGLSSASAPSGIVPVSSAERRKVRVR